MSVSDLLRRLPGPALGSLIAGLLLLMVALGARSVPAALAGFGALGLFGWTLQSATRPRDLEPWQWPEKFRGSAEAMARPIDPTPKRLIPLDPIASEIAQVEVTAEGLQRLLVEKPPMWRWAAFASILVQRRNAVQVRLRNCALGYQPRAGTPLTAQSYSQLAYRSMLDIADLVQQLEQFMLAPAFMGAFGNFGEESTADPDSINHIANRLMDYHRDVLIEAERLVQTPVESDAIVFVQDAGAFAMCPLVGYEQFIVTMCDRVAEGRELLPYTQSVIELDDVQLHIELPDKLMDQIVMHMKRFNS